MIRFLLVLTVGVLATQPGCKCSNDRPYVPYTIGSTPTTSSGRPAPTASAPVLHPIDGGTFTRVAAQSAPPGTSSWNLGGVAITAPPGRYFVSGLVAAPGTVVAFVGDGGSMAGEVVRYVTTETGRLVGPTTLARLPEWLPTGQDCAHMPALSLVGPSTIWLDVASVCKTAQKPNRYLAAVNLKAEGQAVRLDLRVSDPAPGERLAFDADAADRDGDGQDDLLVQVALEGLPTPLTATTKATAALKFLARPTGLSREPTEPGQGLRGSATWIGSLAAKRDQAENALAQARQGRRLQTLLCAEQGAPVVTMGDGAPLPCQDAAAAFDDLRYAEGRAEATLGQIPAAFMVAAGWRDVKKPPKRLADLDAAIEATAPAKKVNGRPLRVMPVANRVALPMAFDASGALLVLSEEGGVVSVNPATGDEAPAAGAATWNPLAELVGDLKVRGGSDDCRAGFLSMVIQSDAGPRKLPTTTPGSTGPGCQAELPVALLDRGGEGLTVLLQGEPQSINKEGERVQSTGWPTGPARPGTVRSPDGRWTALTSSDRVLLRGPDRSEIWKPTTRFTLTACTPAPDGRAVACLLERGIVLLTP